MADWAGMCFVSCAVPQAQMSKVLDGSQLGFSGSSLQLIT